MEKQVTVFAKCKAKQGTEENVKKELLALIPPTRLEEGCVSYDLHQAVDNPSVFVFCEIWSSKEHLESHMRTPHFQALAKKAEDIFAEPIDIVLSEMVSEK